jgi:hypothetical protein
MPRPEPKPPRSAEEIIQSLRDMKKSLEDGYQLREPEFVLTRSEMLFLVRHEEKTQEALKKSRAYAERVDTLLLSRNEELMQERLQREAYQLAAEAGVETIAEMQARVEELERENGWHDPVRRGKARRDLWQQVERREAEQRQKEEDEAHDKGGAEEGQA